MTLLTNLVRTVPSAKFICCCWCNPWCDCHVTYTLCRWTCAFSACQLLWAPCLFNSIPE